MKKLIIIFGIALAFSSCSRNPLKIDVSKIEINVDFQDFDKDLQTAEIDSSLVNSFNEKYGEFFKIFTQRMIWIGNPEADDFLESLNSFTNDTLIIELRKMVKDRINQGKAEEGLIDAFKHYKYYFHEKEIPSINFCISGFNQSIVTSNGLIGISLDKFMGTDTDYYIQLGLPEYKRKRMNDYNIIPETMRAWAITEFPKKSTATNLLSQMIYQGKIMYYMDAMLPELHDTLKIGYTKKELDFCEASESSMWTFLAEHKLLYSSERMDIKRFIDDGPYTNSFSTDSPGRTGVWLGWQIVRSYMKKNPEASLNALMENPDYQEILSHSGYHPE